MHLGNRVELMSMSKSMLILPVVNIRYKYELVWNQDEAKLKDKPKRHKLSVSICLARDDEK